MTIPHRVWASAPRLTSGDRSIGDLSNARPAVLPTIVGLSVALGRPVPSSVRPLMLQSPAGSSSAVLLSQSMLWLLTGTVIVVTCWWDADHGPGSVFVASHGKPHCWQPCWASPLGLLSLFSPWPRAGFCCCRRGGTVDTVAASGPAWQVLAVVLTVSVTEELLFRAYPIASGTPHGCPMAGSTTLAGCLRCVPPAGMALGACPGCRAAPGPCHDRPLPVATQRGIRDHHPFLLDLPIVLSRSASCRRCRRRFLLVAASDSLRRHCFEAGFLGRPIAGPAWPLVTSDQGHEIFISKL
jgi:hypothetical protein